MPILQRETAVYPETLFRDAGHSADNTDRRWSTVYTRSRAEKALARLLVACQVPFYLPLVPGERFARGRRWTTFMPLFTGYLFLFGTTNERTEMLTHGGKHVSRVLDVEDQESLCEDLRQVERLIATDAPLTVERRLEPGQLVRVKRGVLAGLEGMIIRRRSNRLIVTVDYLQQGVSVEIDDFMIESI